MALMWPRQLPPDVIADPLRSTEREVYYRLARQLADDWWVFYSRPWLGLTDTGDEVDGECDFVVGHARHGILFIEVKGGAVSRDPLLERWTTRDRHGFVHTIKNPVAQAMRSKHRLCEKLQARLGGQGNYRRRHGVVLPHSQSLGRDLGPDMPESIFCFADQYEHLGRWVESRFAIAEARTGQESGLGIAGLHALRDMLALPIQLRTPLVQGMKADDQEIQYLTQQQFHILAAIEALPRVLIQGGAGTGKTVMAAQLTRMLSDTGHPTLLTCYNEALAERLHTELAGVPHVEVMSFHTLCLRLLREARLDVPEDSDRTKFFESLLPDAAERAAASLGHHRYSAIVVDEGQDFRDSWWFVLDALRTSPAQALLRVFADTNQALYGDPARLGRDLQLIPIRLTWNLRNTREIHAAAYRHYSGIPVSCSGPQGETPHLVTVGAEEEMLGALTRTLSELLSREGIQAEDIAVLAPDSGWIQQRVPADKLLAGVRTATANRPVAGRIVLDSIRRFKGLEAPLVIVLVNAAVAASAELAYVALSRARARLFLIGQPPQLRFFLGQG